MPCIFRLGDIAKSDFVYWCYRSEVCLFVCLSVTFVHCAQTARYRHDFFCIRHIERRNVAFCQITLTLVLEKFVDDLMCYWVETVSWNIHDAEQLTDALICSCRSSPCPWSVAIEGTAPLTVCANCIVSTLAAESSVSCRHTTTCRVAVAFTASADCQIRQSIEQALLTRFRDMHTHKKKQKYMSNKLSKWRNINIHQAVYRPNGMYKLYIV